jgi:DNA-3-methyladenine glycosylase
VPPPRAVRPRRRPARGEEARLRALLSRPTEDAARGLIGCVLVRRSRGRALAARIVEAEAYLGHGDPAAHVFRGRTPRTEPLFGPPGTLYVYLVYGMHHCLNLAVDGPGSAGCVLVRAAEPLPGSGLTPDACRGPGRLCRALGIDTRLSGRHLFEKDAPLTLREGVPPPRVGVSGRVGIGSAASWPLRFYDPASPAVSARAGAGISSGAAQRRRKP